MISTEKIPKKMQALVLHAVGDLRLEEVEIPQLKEGSVLLHIKCCGICSSDNDRIFKNGTYHFPTIPGHEFSGEIVGAYDKQDRDLLGKKASVFPLLPCNNCEACQMEEYAQCSNYSYFGSRCDGAFSEYLVVPKWNLVYFDNMDFDVAALCEPAAVSLHAVRRFNIEKGKKVLVMGSGTIGLLIAMFAKVQGNTVYIGARIQAAIDDIKKLGLNYIDTNNLEEELKNKTNNKGFDYVFEAIGSNESIEKSIIACGNFAKIILVGNPHEDLKLEKNTYWKVLRKQITITGTWNSSYSSSKNDWQDALEFMKDNYNIFKGLITHTYTLEEYEEAFNVLKDKNKYKIKIMFKNK